MRPKPVLIVLLLGAAVSTRATLQAQSQSETPAEPSNAAGAAAESGPVVGGAPDPAGTQSEPQSQTRTRPQSESHFRVPAGATAGAARVAEPRTGTSAVERALVRVYRLPFARPTTLEEVRAHLQKTLKIPVVLDLAALERQALATDDPVQLELDGVRLKTGLQLLLDQVGLTYRIVAGDDLLVITDKEGSDDPLDRMRAEIHELHRDVHTLQQSIDDLTDLLLPEGLDAPMRRPTIIEELPGPIEGGPGSGAAPDETASSAPSSAPAPSPGAGAAPSPTPTPTPGGDSARPHGPSRRSGGRIRPNPLNPPPAAPPAEAPPAGVPLSLPRKSA